VPFELILKEANSGNKVVSLWRPGEILTVWCPTGTILHGENEVFQRNRNDFPKVSFTLDVIWGHMGRDWPRPSNVFTGVLRCWRDRARFLTFTGVWSHIFYMHRSIFYKTKFNLDQGKVKTLAWYPIISYPIYLVFQKNFVWGSWGPGSLMQFLASNLVPGALLQRFLEFGSKTL
jgi:hypothetical protein